MGVEVMVDGPETRGWHVALARALAARSGTSGRVTVVATAPKPSWGPEVDALLGSERRRHGLRCARSDTAPVTAAPARWCGGRSGGEPDPAVRIGLGATVADGCWRVTFDGRADEVAAVEALLAHRFPVVRVLDETGAVLAEGRPGSETPGVVAAALEDVLAGSVELVLAAVAGHRPRLSELPGPLPPVGRTDPAREAVRRSRRLLATTTARRVYRALYRSPHWRVGWRRVDGPGVLATGELPAGGWHDLPDDGRHFYADPFPVTHGGRTHLFVEDFEHRLGRGVISVVEFDDDGPVGTPRPVLVHDVHLSYPVVLEDDGEMWMIPETSAAGTVELYRAARFPDRWVLEAVLLRDVDASDVTPFRHDGRWWLSATVRRGGSCSDALHLWYADRLCGPWSPHDHNPVLVDIASARPGGHVELHEGRLLRPAQDGRTGYGGALTLAEIVELGPSAFAQRVVAHLRPGASWPGSRLHTLNRAGRFEFIDGSARSPRLRPPWAIDGRP